MTPSPADSFPGGLCPGRAGRGEPHGDPDRRTQPAAERRRSVRLPEIAERLGAIAHRQTARRSTRSSTTCSKPSTTGPARHLSHAVKTGRLVVAAALVVDCWRHAERDLAGNLIIALRRADVTDLDTAGADRTPTFAAPTDSLLATPSWPRASEFSAWRNDRALAAQATILDIDGQARTITIRTDRDDTFTLPRRCLNAATCNPAKR